jgi:uridine kinase
MFKKAILIGIAGGSGSGKTSVARAVTADFAHSEVALIEQDSYYKDLSHLSFEQRTKMNFDHPDAVNFDLMKEQVATLTSGGRVDVPIYDYTTHAPSKDTHHFEGQHIVILEGILALHRENIRSLMDIKLFVDAPDDVRMMRRIKRDIKERGRTLDSVLEQYVRDVRPMHIQYVEPTKQFADIIIPEGGHNTVAIDIIRTKIWDLLRKR